MNKKIILSLIALAYFTSCKAQISPLFGDNSIYEPNSGFYYKDVDNDFDKFVGEWKWEENNSSFTIILEKQEQIDDGDGYTYDILYGEYQYINNGTELMNTLMDMNDTSIEPLIHKVRSPLILANHYIPKCNDCEEGERRVRIVIVHPDYDHIRGKLVMRYKIENGVEKIYAKFLSNRASYRLSEEEPSTIGIPFTDYVFIKQD